MGWTRNVYLSHLSYYKLDSQKKKRKKEKEKKRKKKVTTNFFKDSNCGNSVKQIKLGLQYMLYHRGFTNLYNWAITLSAAKLSFQFALQENNLHKIFERGSQLVSRIKANTFCNELAILLAVTLRAFPLAIANGKCREKVQLRYKKVLATGLVKCQNCKFLLQLCNSATVPS